MIKFSLGDNLERIIRILEFKSNAVKIVYQLFAEYIEKNQLEKGWLNQLEPIQADDFINVSNSCAVNATIGLGIQRSAAEKQLKELYHGAPAWSPIGIIEGASAHSIHTVIFWLVYNAFFIHVMDRGSFNKSDVAEYSSIFTNVYEALCKMLGKQSKMDWATRAHYKELFNKR